jgi:hypothetical protein
VDRHAKDTSHLEGSDPRLRALFGAFTRLNCDSDVPRVEELKAGSVRRFARARIRTILFAPVAWRR